MPFPISHPDLPGSLGEALDDQQFAEIWEPRGWERAPIPDEFTEPVALASHDEVIEEDVVLEDDAPEAVTDDSSTSSRRTKNAPDPTVESIEGV